MYVPARYVAEELGANVDWNKQTQTVSINKQNSETTNPVDEEKTPVVTVPSTPVEQKPCNCDIKSDYEKLPLSKINEGIIVDVYDVVLKNDRTTFYVKVKNITDLPMQLDQESVTFTTDGETYKHTQLDETILFRKDTAWYNDIQEDERKEGFIMIPGLPEEVKEGTLNLTVVQNDRTQKEIPFQFKVKWD
nr:stalk domain-containing protein [Ammoniphilus resinae]